MNVHLTQELEQLVHSRVNSGRYASASEAVREALRLLAERDELMNSEKVSYERRSPKGLILSGATKVSTARTSLLS